MKVIVRADGNANIGMGHVMRCLSLADALAAKQVICIFVISDEHCLDVITNRGFEVVVLQTKLEDYGESAIGSFMELISLRKPDMVVVDSYYVTQDFFTSVQSVTKTVYITEDCPSESFHHIDYFINYNIYANDMLGERHDISTKFILGSQYTLLRNEFKDCSSEKKETNQIVIFTGGSDPLNIATELCSFLLQIETLQNYNVNIVSGLINPNLDSLYELERKSKRVHIITAPPCMSKVMLEQEIAISSAGSTLYELCACQIPTISYIYADNQRMLAQEFAKKKIIPYAGDMRIDRRKVINNIIELLMEYLRNKREWSRRAENMHKFCDGQGALRVANILLGLPHC